MKLREALHLRGVIEQSAQSLDDATASTAASLFPKLKADGTLMEAGTRINWNGTIKRAAANLWDTAENDPDHAPALWEDIQYRAGCRIIPAVITVTTAFAEGECGWWGDVLYRSKLDNHVYTPEQYPEGWEKVE